MSTRAWSSTSQVNGRTKIALRNVISDYIPNPTFEVVATPGAQEEYFKDGNKEGKSHREILGKPMKAIPAFRDPAARIELMDEMGLQGALMWPTLASLLEERLGDDVLATHAVIHALNQWMHDDWTFNYQDRIFPTPVINLGIVERGASRSSTTSSSSGARVMLIRPAPVPGLFGKRSMALPEFDPFWAKVAEADILVGLHASDSGYQRYVNEWEGVARRRDAAVQGPLGLRADHGPLLPAGRRHGHLADRARAVHAVSRRCGSRRSKTAATGCARCSRRSSRATSSRRPISRSTRSRCSSATSSSTRSTRRTCRACVELLGPDRVIFGSDWPHPEGLADPISYVDELKGLPDADVRAR